MNTNTTNINKYPPCPVLPSPQGKRNSAKKQFLEESQPNTQSADILPNVLFQCMLSFLSPSDQYDLPCISKRFRVMVYEAYEKYNWINQSIFYSHPNDDYFENDSFNTYINFKKNLNPSYDLTREQVLIERLPQIRKLEVSSFKSLSSAFEFNKNLKLPLLSLKLSYLNAYIDDDSEGNPQIFNLIAQRCPYLKILEVNGISNFEESQGLSALFSRCSLSSFSFTAITAEQIKKLSEEINENVPLHSLHLDCDLDAADITEKNVIKLLSKTPSLLSFKNNQVNYFTDQIYIELSNFCKNLTYINLSSERCTLNGMTVLMQNCRNLTHFINDRFLNILVENQPGENQDWYKYCPQLTYLQLKGDGVDFERFRGPKIYKDEDTQYNTSYIINMLSYLPNLTFFSITKLIYKNLPPIHYSLDVDCIMKNVRKYNKKLRHIINEKAVQINGNLQIINPTLTMTS